MTACLTSPRTVESPTATRGAESGGERRMLQVRTYEGDAAPLSTFIGSVWRATYAGKMPLPIWDEPYFNWQLLWRPPVERPYCLAAYDGKKLVGTLLGEEFRFRWLEREHLGRLSRSRHRDRKLSILAGADCPHHSIAGAERFHAARGNTRGWDHRHLLAAIVLDEEGDVLSVGGPRDVGNRSIEL